MSHLSSSSETNSPRRWRGLALDIILAVLIFFVALSPRVAVAQAYTEAPQSEEKLYDRYAWPWAQGLGTEPRETPFPWHPLGSFTHRPPAYGLVLGITYRIFGHDFGAARMVQAIIGALACVLTFVIGRQVANRWVGLAAAVIAAEYSFLIGFSARLMSEPLFILLMLLMVVLLLWARASGRLLILLAACYVLGWANLTRGVLLLPFIPLLVIWLWFIPAFRRRFWVTLGIVALGLLLSIGPVTLRNYQFHHRFLLISSNGGQAFYHGMDTIPGLSAPDELPSLDDVKNRNLAELDEDVAFRNLKLAYLMRHPGDILPILNYQREQFLSAEQGYKISDVVIPVPEDPLAWPLLLLGGVLSVFLIPKAYQKRALLYIVILSLMSMDFAFHMETRFRLPLAPLLAVLSCWAIWSAAEFLVRRTVGLQKARRAPGA
ncbi:MAG: glycosyltransferase family 39 protein [Anaerolineae bacterium]